MNTDFTPVGSLLPTDYDFSESAPSAELDRDARASMDAAIREVLGDTVTSALTPDMIIMLAQRRLNDLDRQIEGGMSAIEGATTQSEALAYRTQVLEGLRQQAMTRGSNPDTKLRAEATTTITVGGEQMSISSALESAGLTIDDLQNTTLGQIDSMLEQVKSESKRITSRNEMQMMQLQTAMGQRTQAIQLCTNMLKTLADGSASVIGNMR